jgi:cytochrome c-type biogenesis protein CcmH
MNLWPYLTILCSASAVALAYPLIRRYENSSERAAREVAIYTDQIKEVQADLGTGAISATDAALASGEIQRRLAAAAKSVESQRPLSGRWK